jgi:hypothetical protein
VIDQLPHLVPRRLRVLALLLFPLPAIVLATLVGLPAAGAYLGGIAAVAVFAAAVVSAAARALEHLFPTPPEPPIEEPPVGEELMGAAPARRFEAAGPGLVDELRRRSDQAGVGVGVHQEPEGPAIFLPAPAGGEATGPPKRPVRTSDIRRLPAVSDEQPIGPWAGRVKITPLEGDFREAVAAGSQVLYEVLAEWRGPGLPDLPPVDGAVEARDTITTPELGLAKAIAGRAGEQLRASSAPDLRSIKRELEHR